MHIFYRQRDGTADLNPSSSQPGAKLKRDTSPALARLMDLFNQSQWWSPEDLRTRQLGMLRELLKHHEQHTPWVRGRIAQSGQQLDELTASLEAWSGFPVTTRRDLQEADLHSRYVPATHEPVMFKKSSGSTGEPVAIRRTAFSQLFWQACTLREHLWHQRSPSGTLVAVRANLTQAMVRKNWGSPIGNFFTTGPSFGIPSNTDVNQLLQWIKKIQPNYLLIYPNVWHALLDATRGETGIWDKLHQVRTLGETVTDELRDRTRTEANAELVDLYSAEELGTIALQCPQSGLYHVMAEGLIVEVLNAEGESCLPGETGRVVVTDLTNLATPLLRYEIGDYAEAGHLCGCGRGLPTLKRILGREHSMVKLPDGSRHWPTTGIRDFPSDAAVRQCQLVQRSLQTMEVRLVVSRGNLNATEEAALSKIIQNRMGYNFDCRFIYFKDQIPRHPSGKFEEFICEI